MSSDEVKRVDDEARSAYVAERLAGSLIASWALVQSVRVRRARAAPLPDPEPEAPNASAAPPTTVIPVAKPGCRATSSDIDCQLMPTAGARTADAERANEVRPATRVVSVLAVALYIYFAAGDGHNRTAEIGLALVIGSVLFATPQLVGSVISSERSSPSKASTVYLRVVSLFATIELAFVILGSHPDRANHLQILLLAVLALIELIVIAYIPVFYIKMGATLLGPDRTTRLRASLAKLGRKPYAVLRYLEQHDAFLFLAGACFFIGSTMQMIAGA